MIKPIAALPAAPRKPSYESPQEIRSIRVLLIPETEVRVIISRVQQAGYTLSRGLGRAARQLPQLVAEGPQLVRSGSPDISPLDDEDRYRMTCCL